MMDKQRSLQSYLVLNRLLAVNGNLSGPKEKTLFQAFIAYNNQNQHTYTTQISLNPDHPKFYFCSFNYNIMTRRSKIFTQLITFTILLTLVLQVHSSPLMIEEKDEFLQKLRTKNIAVLFYGDSQSPEYQSFEQLIPSTHQLFDGIEFIYVPTSKFKLNRPAPSLSIYRKIGGGDWQLYKGNFDKLDMDRWIQHNIMDPLKELTIENLERMFRESQPGFILLSYGEFELIRTKIFVSQFCNFKNIKCWKVEPTTPIYSVVVKLMGIEKQDLGESKLAFYSPQTERLQLYTQDLWKLKRQQLLEMYEGRQGIIHSETPEGEIQIELHYEEADQEI